MATSSLIKIKSLNIYFIISFMLLIIGCDVKTVNNGASGDMDVIEVDGTVYIEKELQSEMLPGDVKRIKDVLIKKVLPTIPEKEKVELNEIIHHLDYIQENSPEYFEDDNNIINFYKTAMRFYLLNSRLNPDNFDTHLTVATKYIVIAVSLEGHVESIDSVRAIEDFKRKGILASKELIDRFPENPMSYAQLGHALYYIEGKAKEAAVQFKKCLELDKKSEYCRENHAIVMDELRSSSQ